MQDKEGNLLWRLSEISVNFVDDHGETDQLPGCDHGKAAKFSWGDGKAAKFSGGDGKAAEFSWIDGKTEKFSRVYGEAEELPNSNGEAAKLWWQQ